MTQSNFPICLSHVLKHEGGYVDHPKDPGGATNKGITIGTLSKWLGRKATKQEVRDIPDDVVHDIYKSNYWDRVRGDNLPDGLDLVAFDGGVNSGVSRGARWLQKGLGVKADGVVGDKTLGKAAHPGTDGVKVIEKACAARMGFLRSLRTFSTFGRGWSRRVAAVEASSVAMYTKSAAMMSIQAQAARKEAQKKTGEATGSGILGGTSQLADMPQIPSYMLMAALLLLAIALASKVIHQNNRIAAYEALKGEL